MKQKLTITANEVLELHKIARSDWKGHFANSLSKLSSDQIITFRQEEVDKMFQDATDSQLPVLERIFGKKEVFPDRTPCLVSDCNKDYRLRYANGKGEFYNDTKKSGRSISWKYSRKLDLNNLPVNES